MRIDLLKTSPDRAGRHFVRFEDGSSMRLYRQTVEDFGLFAGMELSEEKMEALREAAGKMSAKMRAVRIVSATSVSQKDLEQRLVRKGEDPVQAKQAVQWMSELSLLDDRKVAEQIVHRAVSKGYGAARARQMLFEKKIPREYWEDALADYPDQTDKIMEFLQTRLKNSEDGREVKKAVDALMRRGHRYGQIRKALDQLQLEAENFREEF